MIQPSSPDGSAAGNAFSGTREENTTPASGTSASDSPVRRGSPFAKSLHPGDRQSATADAAALAMRVAEPAFDPEWGVLRAANWASAWVAICGLACLQMFPGGGVVVAALGCALATVGLFSSRVVFAAVLLATHAWLFFACYQRLF